MGYMLQRISKSLSGHIEPSSLQHNHLYEPWLPTDSEPEQKVTSTKTTLVFLEKLPRAKMF